MAAAINNNQGSLLTNVYSTPPIANVAGADGPFLRGWAAYCAIPVVGTDLAGSTYGFGFVKSSDCIFQIRFGGTALTAGALSLGLYKVTSTGIGAVAATNSDHLFATSISLASAVAPTDNRYTNLALTTAGKRVWELLGLASDPCLNYMVAATSTTGATAAGTLFCDLILAP
jgi:hypothetical protein